MWNKEKSVLLTQFIVRACYVLLAAAVIILPFIFKEEGDSVRINMLATLGKYVIAPFYVLVPAGYAALICIDKLLINIKKEIVFDVKNVKLLRIISWCCFYAAIACVSSFIIIAIVKNYILGTALILVGAGALFMGLILRVIKNVFEHAIVIKDENDLTI